MIHQGSIHMRISLLPVLLLSLGAFGQGSDRYIELTVSDTAEAPVKSVLYFCSVQLDATTMYDPSLTWRQQQKKQVHVMDSLCHDQQELEEQLIQAGFRLGVMTNPGYKYNVAAENLVKCGTGSTVEVSSYAELLRLVSFVRSKRNVNGSVVTWITDPFVDASATQRMLAIARSRAEQLASLSGQRLGPLLRAQSMNFREQWTSTVNDPLQMVQVAVPQYFYGHTTGAVQGNMTEPNPPMMTFRFALLGNENTTGARP
jgi:hypothetical protein